MTLVPRVSLYIPAYNAAGFLNASIEALLSQTLPPDEILVVDDGSRDATVDVVSRYKEAKLIRHDRNRGLAAARNTAVRAARNELVGSVDADCAADPAWLEKLVPCVRGPEDRRSQRSAHRGIPGQSGGPMAMRAYAHGSGRATNSQPDVPAWLQLFISEICNSQCGRL